MDKNFSRDALRFTHMERGFGGYCLRAILASCMALAIVAGPIPALAGNSKGQQTSSHHRFVNQQRIHKMKERIADLRERLRDHRKNHHKTGSSNTSLDALQAQVDQLATTVAALVEADTKLLEALTNLQNENLPTRVASLESQPTGGSGGIPDLEKYVFLETGDKNGVKGPHLVFRGVNVHVQSGSNMTIDTSGLGNLIVGYNENSPSNNLNRLGSHNLVGGQMNAFSASGGMVFGSNNNLSGRFSGILGGENNQSPGWFSTVYGGQFNNSLTNYSFTPAIGGGGN